MDKLREMQVLLSRIPKGKVTTYKILARHLGIHPRHAGIMLGRNTDTKQYPCYKVIRSDGTLGGYILGIKKKTMKLRNDGIKVVNNKVDIKKYLFRL